MAPAITYCCMSYMINSLSNLNSKHSGDVSTCHKQALELVFDEISNNLTLLTTWYMQQTLIECISKLYFANYVAYTIVFTKDQIIIHVQYMG